MLGDDDYGAYGVDETELSNSVVPSTAQATTPVGVSNAIQAGVDWLSGALSKFGSIFSFSGSSTPTTTTPSGSSPTPNVPTPVMTVNSGIPDWVKYVSIGAVGYLGYKYLVKGGKKRRKR